VNEEMAARLPLYRAAGLFHPHRYLWENSKDSFSTTLHSCIDQLVHLKGVSDPVTLKTEMLGEHVKYVRAAKEWQAMQSANPEKDTPDELWLWWRTLRTTIPAWFTIAKILVLLQPSSAAIEQFYALVKANSTERQVSELLETFATRCMLMYN